MRILHLADLHIGKILNGYSMIEEQKYILSQILHIVDRYAVETVIIAGDIYDRSIPPKEALTVYNDFLGELLLKRNLPVLAISGNHDSGERLEAGSALMEQVQYYMEGTFKREVRCVTLCDGFGEIDFYLIAFADVAEVRLVLEEESIKTFDEAMEKIIDGISLRKGIRSVVVAHCYAILEDGFEEEKVDSQKPLSIGGKDFVKSFYFEKFNYAALGHLHRKQKVGKKNIRYCGTALKYSFSEEKHQKAACIVELDHDGEVEILEEPLFPLHNLRTIQGKFDEILKQAQEDTDKEDFIRFFLEDEGMIADAMSMLKAYYPNAMELRYLFREQEMAQMLHREEKKSHSVSEMAKLFYRQNYEKDMEQGLLEELQECLKAIEGDKE